MAETNIAAIDETSKAMLTEHVKKGKARKFILITKGAAIKTLIVFKLGPFGPKIMKAKKDGFRGEVTCGVITGKGVNLTFKLPGTPEVSSAMKTEGNIYEGEPCKIAKLRMFFRDEGDLKFKPEFQVVRELKDVTPVSELDEETESNVADVALGDVESAERKQTLVAKLKGLTAAIQQAIAAAPDRKEEILAPAAVIKEHLQADRLDDADRELTDYETFLQGIQSSGSPTGAPAPPAPPPPPPLTQTSPKLKEWGWRSKQLAPKLKRVLSEKLGDFSQVAAVYKEAQRNKEEDIEKAVELLKQCAQLVDLALSEGEAEWADPTDQDRTEVFTHRLKSLLPQVKEAAGKPHGDEAKRLTTEAGAFAQKKDFDQAHSRLDQVEQLLLKATETVETDPGTDQDVMTIWRDAKESTDAGVEELRKHLMGHEDERLARIAEMGLNGITDGNQTKLMAALMEYKMVGAEAREKAGKSLASQVSQYRTFLESSAPIDLCERNPFGVNVNIKGPLSAALDKIERAIAN